MFVRSRPWLNDGTRNLDIFMIHIHGHLCEPPRIGIFILGAMQNYSKNNCFRMTWGCHDITQSLSLTNFRKRAGGRVCIDTTPCSKNLHAYLNKISDIWIKWLIVWNAKGHSQHKNDVTITSVDGARAVIKYMLLTRNWNYINVKKLFVSKTKNGFWPCQRI